MNVLRIALVGSLLAFGITYGAGLSYGIGNMLANRIAAVDAATR